MQPEAEERWAIIKSMALEYYAYCRESVARWQNPGLQLTAWLNNHETIKKYPLAFASCRFFILNFLMYAAENGVTDNPSAAYDAYKEDIQKFIEGEKRFYETILLNFGHLSPAAYEDVPRIQGITTT